ncbi:MAG: hypothetical protein ACE5JQ_00830 [Candidatus Methylomirabilales bacterium]
MHRLVELDHVEGLLRDAERFSGGNCLVMDVGGFAKSMLKFSSISVCEVFGYQIAAAVGIRVARTQGIWTQQAVNAVGPGSPGILAEPGRIGILVEYHDAWANLPVDHAVRLDPVVVSRALGLCAFDRYEWGEFGHSGGKIYFADLERLLPGMQPEVLLAASPEERITILEATEDPYKQGTATMIQEVLEEADRLRISSEVERELETLSSLRPETYSKFLQLIGHPLDRLLSRFATSVFGWRVNAIADYIGRPTHEVPDWR